jgi:hypothetical protein
MQLVSFFICFAVALHVVFAAPFPADNQSVPWQLGGPITQKATKAIEGRKKRAQTRGKFSLDREDYHEWHRDHHIAKANEFAHDPDTRKGHLKEARYHNKMLRRHERDTANYGVKVSELRYVENRPRPR